MRQNLFIARNGRGVWRAAKEAAEADRMSLSHLATVALRDYLNKRARRLAREAEITQAIDATHGGE